MTRLAHIPRYEGLNDFYGVAELAPNIPSEDFVRERLIRVRLPYPMRLSWEMETAVQVVLIHFAVAEAFLDAEREIMFHEGIRYLFENRYDVFGGSYAYRPMKGGTRLTTHAWGIAVDRNPELAPYYNRKRWPDPTSWKHEQPSFIIEAYTKRGFINLAWDRMHFQACGED